MDNQRSVGSTRRLLGGVMAVVAALAVTLLWKRSNISSTNRPQIVAAVADERDVSLPPKTTVPPGLREPKSAAATVESSEPPSEHEDTGPRHPHPITEDHKRLYREQDLLQAAYLSIKRGDFDEARAQIATHRREYPGLAGDMELGLEVLLDCVESPSAGTRQRAQSFYDTHTYSKMRRRVRRLCLE